MTPEERSEIVAQILAASEKSRGYASFFEWAIDKDIAEWGVVVALAESMEMDGALFFRELKRRGRGNDPPDCEALNHDGERVAIEVTELVDPDAIRAYKKGQGSEWVEWSKDQFLVRLATLIAGKDKRYPSLKEPPYAGGYVVVVHTDETMLQWDMVEEFLAGHMFEKPKHVDGAFLLVSYHPSVGRCPYFELAFKGELGDPVDIDRPCVKLRRKSG